MNTPKQAIIKSIVAIIAIAALSSTPVLAQSKNSSAGREQNRAVTRTERLAALGTKGEKEIQIRVDSLNKLIVRVQDLRNVSDTQKGSIVTTLQGLITNLTNLKTQIESESSTTALKTDSEAVVQNYRIYALAIPQLNIFAAADRITTITAMMNVISNKLHTRLLQAVGVPNMTALESSLSDLDAKVANAYSEVQAAVAGVSPLTPDQGDKTKMASNLAAMKDARTKIQTAQKDLVAARKDAQTIITALVKSDKAIMNSGTEATSSESGAAATTSAQ